MKKLLVLIAFGTLAGCDLYFGPPNPGSGGGGGGGGGGGTGFGCATDGDCAAGCYCDPAKMVCTEGGFCTTDADCGTGFHCDTNRSSCVPNNCTCTNDKDAQQKGFGWCDDQGVCQTGTDPRGDCAGTVTCTAAPPACGEHTVPLILDGCYTGECRAIADCVGAPGCSSLQHEDDCLAANATCNADYTGINCHKPDGSACQSGDTGCTCDSFVFHNCSAKAGG